MTDPEPTPGDPPWLATDVELLPWLEVAPGIRRRSLPSCPELDVWLIEFDAHSRWPDVDHHLDVEEVLVLEGEFIDCGHSYGAGTFLHFEPGTSHQPRTETGGRMFGYNFVPGWHRRHRTATPRADPTQPPGPGLRPSPGPEAATRRSTGAR